MIVGGGDVNQHLVALEPAVKMNFLFKKNGRTRPYASGTIYRPPVPSPVDLIQAIDQ